MRAELALPPAGPGGPAHPTMPPEPLYLLPSTLWAVRARRSSCFLGVPGRGTKEGAGAPRVSRAQGLAGVSGSGAPGVRRSLPGRRALPGSLTLRGLPTESPDEHLAAGGGETQRARVSAGRQGAGGAGPGPGEARPDPDRPCCRGRGGRGPGRLGRAGPGRTRGRAASPGRRGRAGARQSPSGAAGGAGSGAAAAAALGAGQMRSAAKGAGRTGHAAPSPDPARAGGRAGTAEGRARRGPTCRLLPPPPCAHKAPRAPGRPRRRRRRRDPAPAGLPGPRGRERPRIPMRAGTWARPHPPTHPSAGAGPRGTPSRNEALPGAFKVARFRIGYPLPSPVLPLRSPLSRIYEIPNLSGSGWSQPQRPPIPNW